ncbi:hypothetical protein AB0R87_12895 [Bacillus pumilus]|uniref:hypothetical protein n=1 Tax=Bacillus pumilus TaxID=1408 RepID=UPI00285FFB29|nr:hypothetical protein [Bacillus pumilus]MDR7248937.1 hypothetical protein [Bacillus pumilus]
MYNEENPNGVPIGEHTPIGTHHLYWWSRISDNHFCICCNSIEKCQTEAENGRIVENNLAILSKTFEVELHQLS